MADKDAVSFGDKLKWNEVEWWRRRRQHCYFLFSFLIVSSNCREEDVLLGQAECLEAKSHHCSRLIISIIISSIAVNRSDNRRSLMLPTTTEWVIFEIRRDEMLVENTLAESATECGKTFYQTWSWILLNRSKFFIRRSDQITSSSSPQWLITEHDHLTGCGRYQLIKVNKSEDTCYTHNTTVMICIATKAVLMSTVCQKALSQPLCTHHQCANYRQWNVIATSTSFCS